MNTSRRTALKVAGTSAMLVAGVSVQDAQAATRSGGHFGAATGPIGSNSEPAEPADFYEHCE